MLFPFLSLIGLAAAGAELHAHDGHVHAHVHEKREYPQVPLTPPYRPLVWGDFNVIHTTDTHGWLLGHQEPSWPEPNYSGDLGDFASFVTHMKQIAIDKDVDLLLIDTGDLHDGTGLSDGYPPGGVDGHDSNKFMERLPYDVMTIGNHELYDYAVAYDMYTNFVPHMNHRYLSSNANITILNAANEIVSVPIGDRYTKFTTRKGRTVTSIGVIFNFTSNSVNTTIQPVAKMVKEQWFEEAIAEEPDVFVLAGHMPVSRDSWPDVFDAIRCIHPYTPILILGGHTHVRDCRQYDGRSIALESGCFMETIGWMSADLDAAKGNTDNITFTRRYLDQNRVTYQYHTSTTNASFDTPYGRSITHDMHGLATEFDLEHLYGTAPQDYTLFESQFPSSGNALEFFITEAAPVVFAMNNPRAGIPNIIISNTGLMRYSVFKGPFNKNDQLTAAPYRNAFLYIANVTARIANQALPALNRGECAHPKSEEELWDRDYVESRYRSWLEDMSKRQVVQPTPTANLTPGYVTRDGCPDPDRGDDTLHTALPHYSFPKYISSNPPNVPDDAPIDFVFYDYIKSRVLCILNKLQNTTVYTDKDVFSYTPTLTNEVLGLYAQAKWN